VGVQAKKEEGSQKNLWIGEEGLRWEMAKYM
jgi:hypothetical protein